MSKTDGFGWGREGRFIYLGTAAIDEIEMWLKSFDNVIKVIFSLRGEPFAVFKLLKYILTLY